MRLVDDLVNEMRVSMFRPLDFELSFAPDGDLPPITIDLGEDGSASLIGVVDRVDGWVRGDKLYLRVVDYKSGPKKFDLTDIWHGLGLQMLIYMFALRENGAERYQMDSIGSGVLYLPVRDVTVSAKRGDSAEKIEKEAAKKLARSGILLAEPDVVCAMYGSATKRYVPAGFTANGAFTHHSSVATLEQFGKLERHISETLRNIARELKHGSTSAEPCIHGGRQVCEYCDFADICRFDLTTGKDSVRYLQHISAEKFWEQAGLITDETEAQ
jgi:ATP-dependent helicase/nuclease subunit B